MEPSHEFLYIGKLVLCNFKAFSSQKFVFGPGVNYVIGDNNCGKTSLLQALQFALTGGAEDAATESMRSSAAIHPSSPKSAYVECSIYGSREAFAQLNSIEAAAPLASYITEDVTGERGTPHITFRRYLYFGKDDSLDVEEKTAQALQAANGNASKATGIQSKILAWDQSASHFVELKKPKNLDFLFQPTYFGALVHPDDVISGNSSSITMKLMTSILENNGFEQGEAWGQYQKASETIKNDPDSGLTRSLQKIGEKVSELICQRFPDTAVRFSSDYKPTLSDMLKKLTVIVEEHGVAGDLSSKGSGLQRDVAFALAKIQAQGDIAEGSPYPHVLFVFDEPENCLHPRAQVSFSSDYRKTNKQCFIATHSPYLLTGFCATNDCCTLLTRAKDTDTPYVDDARQLGKLIPGTPSLGEITYFAFGIPTIEFHNELYGIALRRETVRHGKERDLAVRTFDMCLKEDYGLEVSERQRFNNRKHHDNKSFDGCMDNGECLPTVIRNCIDHPESQAEAIEVYPDRKDELFEITDELLEDSIQLLLRVIEQQSQKEK